MWKSTGPQKGKPDGMGLRKGAILQPARPGRAFKGLGGGETVLQERFDWR